MNRIKALNALGLSEGVLADEIRQAYRKLAMKHHPDRNPGDKRAEERFKEVKKAYEMLSSGNFFEETGEPTRFGDGDGDMFAEMFGSIFGHAIYGVVTASISLFEAINGCELSIDLDPWGASGVMSVKLPAGVTDGTQFLVEAHGRKKMVSIAIEMPPDWSLVEGHLIRKVRLSVLDQLLGVVDLPVSLPDSSIIRVVIPAGLAQGAMLVVNEPSVRPYDIVLKLDFSPTTRLNDNEKVRLNSVRKAIKEREAKNST